MTLALSTRTTFGRTLGRYASRRSIHTSRCVRSASPEELEHFNHLAEDWWNPHGHSRLLHKMNLARVDFVESVINRHAIKPILGSHAGSSWQVLDVGCGGGIFAESIARRPWVSSVTGIDLAQDLLQVAKLHKHKDPQLKDRLSYKLSSLEELPSTCVYDLVTLFEVLEHIPNPFELLREATRRVVPGGFIVLSTINRSPASWVVTKLLGEYLLRLVPVGTHDWEKYINEKDIENWFKRHNASFQNHQPIGSWRVRLAEGTMYAPGLDWVRGLDKDCASNYFLAAQRLD